MQPEKIVKNVMHGPTRIFVAYAGLVYIYTEEHEMRDKINAAIAKAPDRVNILESDDKHIFISADEDLFDIRGPGEEGD